MVMTFEETLAVYIFKIESNPIEVVPLSKAILNDIAVRFRNA